VSLCRCGILDLFRTDGIKLERLFSETAGSKMSDYNNNCLVRCGLCGEDEYKGVALMSGSSYDGRYACNMCVAYSHSSSNPWVCDEFKRVCPFCACDKGLDFDCGYYGASHNIKKNFKCCERCYNEIAKPFNEYIDKALKRADETEAKECLGKCGAMLKPEKGISRVCKDCWKSGVNEEGFEPFKDLWNCSARCGNRLTNEGRGEPRLCDACETEMMCRRCGVIAVHRTQKICDLCEEGNC